jgi:hypothetical protein
MVKAVGRNTFSRTKDANSCSASQKIRLLLWNLKVNYRVHKDLPLVPILSQMNPAHTVPSCFSNIHSIIILTSALSQ